MTAQAAGKPLRFLSLCSGIGGIDLAAEWAGMQIVGQVEIDPYCRRVLAKHWPDVKRIDDIRKVWGYFFGSVDVLGAGFPCQPASVAGQRRGAADARWLWPEVLRVIQVYQPAWVVLENVPGLISLGLDGVLADLDAAGYEAWPLVLPAAAIGAPHLRERLFIVAHTNSERQRQPEGLFREIRRRSGDGGKDVADANQHSGRWTQRAGTGDVGSATRADANDEGDTQRYPAECRGEGVDHAPRQRAGEPDDTAHAFADCGQAWAVSECRSSAGDGQAVACGPGLQGRRARRPVGQSGQTQSGMGGDVDGLPRRVDGRISGAPRHPWPTGPAEPQAPWEAPRTVTGTVPDRAARLKALGNAVVPQQVYPILAAIVAAHEAAREVSA